jgi:hypothetical protein
MDNRSNQYISESLRIADDLMDFANTEAGHAEENGLGILSALMRDCAYKIRRQAELEIRKAKRNRVHANAVLVIFAIALFSIVFASPANATTIILSADDTETLGGLTFSKDDLVEYNPSTDTATLYLDGSLFQGSTDIDAAHVLDSSNIILSTFGNSTLGGLTFSSGDLVEYNPTTDTATLYFHNDLFSQTENIDAAFILDNGNIILSTVGGATLGGLSFGADDLIEYNPTTDTATLFLDGSLFSATENIDAAHVLDSGNIILSTVDSATLGGLSFTCGDLVEYNPTTDVATLYFDENNFTGGTNINAVYVTTLPEPATVALLGLGCLILVRCKRR